MAKGKPKKADANHEVIPNPEIEIPPLPGEVMESEKFDELDSVGKYGLFTDVVEEKWRLAAKVEAQQTEIERLTNNLKLVRRHMPFYLNTYIYFMQIIPGDWTTEDWKRVIADAHKMLELVKKFPE